MKKTIVLLQDTKENLEELTNLFLSASDYQVLDATCDGERAINSVLEKSPHFLITDLVLKGNDGLKVLEKVKKNSGVKVIVLSALCSNQIIAETMSMGASYFMAKPINLELLLERLETISKEDNQPGVIESMAKAKNKISLDERISKIFINVGIPPHIKGYSFLREGVKMAVSDPEIINNITKKLYPLIGEKYNTTASKVERAIRHAIEVAWNRGRIESINSILGVRAYVGAEKPTNGEFIALVADKMLLENS